MRMINFKNSPIEINRKVPKRNITSYVSSLFPLHYPFHGEARYQSDNSIRLRCTLSRRARAIHVIRAINPLEPHSRPFLGIRPPRSFIEVSLWKRVHSWTTAVVRQKAPSSLFSPLILLTVPPLVRRFARLVEPREREREKVHVENWYRYNAIGIRYLSRYFSSRGAGRARNRRHRKSSF